MDILRYMRLRSVVRMAFRARNQRKKSGRDWKILAKEPFNPKSKIERTRANRRKCMKRETPTRSLKWLEQFRPGEMRTEFERCAWLAPAGS